MEKGKGVAADAVDTVPAAVSAAAAAAAEEEETGPESQRERGGSSGSSSCSSWKAGLGTLVASEATATAAATAFASASASATATASASAVVHFLRPTPLATRPRGLPSFQGSAALKSSWIKRLRGLQEDPAEQQEKQIVEARDGTAAAAAAGKEKVTTASMESDIRMVRVFGSGISAPGGRSGVPPTAVVQHQPVDDVVSRRGGETMILSRREVLDGPSPPPPPPPVPVTAGEAEENVLLAKDSAAKSRNGVRTAAPKVTFAPSTKDSEQRRMEPRKRPAQGAEFQDLHPFRFSQMDTVLEDAAAPPPEAGPSGFGIFRLNNNPGVSLPPKPLGPPSKKPAVATSRIGKQSVGSPPPPAAPPPAPGWTPAPSSLPPATAAAGPSLPPTSAELTLSKPRTERKASFQLLKSDITKEEENERLQRRNGQLLESMLANRQAGKGKEIFGAARADGGLEGLSPSTGFRSDGGQASSSFLSYVKKLQFDGRTGEAPGKAKASTSYQPGTSFDGTGADGTRHRGGRMRQVFQDTELGEAKQSQRHAETLSRLWQGIAEQPSLLTPLFAPYKPVDEGSGDPRLPAGMPNDREERPSPLTPLFSPFKFAQDDASQARRMDRPPLPRRPDPTPSPPFAFTATGKRPAAGSSNMAPPAAVPKDFRSQELRAQGSRGAHRPIAAADNPTKLDCQSSHFSNSLWPPQEDAHFGGHHDEAGFRADAPPTRSLSLTRPTASGSVRGFRPGLENDEGSIRGPVPSAFNKRKSRGPADLGEGTHRSGSTPPESGLGMQSAGFGGVLGPNEPLMMPSQSLQARGVEPELQAPPSPKVSKMMDQSPGVSRRLEGREQGLAGASSMVAGVGNAGVAEKSSKPVRRNVLNEVEAERPSYVSSRALHQGSSKRRSFPVQPAVAEDTAEDDHEKLRPNLSQSWINRWLPANPALPSCQPSNSKSPAKPPAERARTNSGRNSPQHSSGIVRVTSYANSDQPGGSTRQDRGQGGGQTSDRSRGFESGRDRWFHAPSETGSPSGTAPSAAAMAIVGRALRNLTYTPPALWRQGTTGMRPSSDSQQASASGPSEQQPRQARHPS